MKSFAPSLVAGFAVLCGLATQIRDRAAAAEPPVAAGAAKDYPGCKQIFNGKDFAGWEADPSTWTIADGAMRGVGGTSRLAYTKADYGSFRLIFTARMNPVKGDHLGVLFWGDRPTDSSRPKICPVATMSFMRSSQEHCPFCSMGRPTRLAAQFGHRRGSMIVLQ